MCLVRPLSDAEKRAATKLKEQRLGNGPNPTWERLVAERAQRFGLAGDALQEFCDIAGVPT